MTLSLTRRLVLIAAAWSLSALLLAGGVLAVLNARLVMARFEQDIAAMALHLATVSENQNDRIVVPALSDPRFDTVYGGRYWQLVMPSRPDPAVRSRSLWDHTLALPDGDITATPRFFNAKGPDGQALRAAALRVRVPDTTTPLVILVAFDRGPIDRDVGRFTSTLFVALAALGAGLLLAVVLQVRIGLAPVYGMQREVAAIRDGRARRLSGAYPSELAPLSDELNALITHSEQVVERARAQVGDLAHALKTPLAVLSAEAQQSTHPSAGAWGRHIDTMARQIDHYLRRARAAARANALGQRAVIAPLVTPLVDALQRIYADKALQIDVRIPGHLAVRLEEQDLVDLLGNVLDNACKWARQQISLTAHVDGQMVALVVSDDGPGLSEAQWQTALKRGQRLDETVPGTGLGLSIVDDLVRGYGGQLHRLPSESGLRVQLMLPAARESEL